MSNTKLNEGLYWPISQYKPSFNLVLDILRNTQPKFPYHSLSLKKDLMLESWVVRRPASFQRG